MEPGCEPAGFFVRHRVADGLNQTPVLVRQRPAMAALRGWAHFWSERCRHLAPSRHCRRRIRCAGPLADLGDACQSLRPGTSRPDPGCKPSATALKLDTLLGALTDVSTSSDAPVSSSDQWLTA